jgi:hypothetical protein
MSTLYRFISTAGICAASGAIAGAFVGGVFGLVEFATANPPLPRLVLLGVAVGLSLFAWLVVLAIVGVFGNYGVRAIASQALVTTGITGILTVFLTHAIHAGLAGMLLGWIIGFLVGKMLCSLCSTSERRVA